MSTGSRSLLGSLWRAAIAVLLIAVCVHWSVKLLVAVWRPLVVVLIAVGIVMAIGWGIAAWRARHRW